MKVEEKGHGKMNDMRCGRETSAHADGGEERNDSPAL